MLFKVFAIYDSKAQAYYPPFFQATVGLATRIFGDMANNPESTVGRYPADYTLFEIGTYDDQTAKMVAGKAHVSHGIALEYVENQKDVFSDLGQGAEEQVAMVNGAIDQVNDNG